VIVVLAIVIYFTIAIPTAMLLGRRLRRLRELAIYGRVIDTARDEQLDITPALRRSR
jgi:hypothetical protein